MSQPELKPCPFCGGPATVWPLPAAALWKVHCDECNARGAHRRTMADAVREWNRRAESVEEDLIAGRAIAWLCMGLLTGFAILALMWLGPVRWWQIT